MFKDKFRGQLPEGSGVITEDKRRGRPPKAPSERKRGNVTVRVRDRFYAKLAEEAAKGQRSLSEEIERGMERYYEQRDSYGDLARSIGAVVKALETTQGRRYFEDEEMRIRTRAAVSAVLDMLIGSAVEDESGEAPDEMPVATAALIRQP
jgi:hypothetical protein